MSRPPSPKPPRIDGRRLRSERTKQLIIEAFLALLRENPAGMPTAAQIAERAGYSVRSIFERFPDLNALRVAATDYSLAQARPLPRRAMSTAIARRASGPRSTTRARTCERGVALWRVLLFERRPMTTSSSCASASAARPDVGRMELMYRPELSTPEETGAQDC